MATLTNHPDFEKFITYLQQSLEQLRDESATTKDEVLLRWQQGAMQVLEQTIDSAVNAKETLRKFQ